MAAVPATLAEFIAEANPGGTYAASCPLLPKGA
jgi:hypothetical protein